MDSATLSEVTFHSSGITGSRDADKLETDLGALEGVRDIDANTDAHTVRVVYDAAIVDANAIRQVIEDDGFTIDRHEDEAPPSSASTAGYNVGIEPGPKI